MKVTEVIVSAGRTFNDPYESYANHKPHVTLKATLADGDDPEAAVKALQAKAEALAEDHKQLMLQQIRDAHNLSERQREVRNLEAQITCAQSRLNDLREAAAKGLPAPEPEKEVIEPEVIDDDEQRKRAYRQCSWT